jgi:hypothetical protein
MSESKNWTLNHDGTLTREFGRVKVSVSSLDEENWYVECPAVHVKSEWVNKGPSPDFERVENLILYRFDELKNDIENIF